MDKSKLPLFSPVVHDLDKRTMTVTIKMDKASTSVIANRMEEYKALPTKLKGAMTEIADYVTGTMIPYTFQKEGPGWKRLAKRTVRERENLGYGGQHPILRRSGDLLDELTHRSHPKHVEIIRVGKNARIEVGGSSAKFLENQLGKSSQHLPARPMIPGTGNIPILDRDRQRMTKIIENAYKQYINKPR